MSKEALPKELILEKIKLGCSNQLHKLLIEDMKLDEYYDVLSQSVIQCFTTWVWAEEIENRKKTVNFDVPASWFQHFKQQFFPNFLLKHFPVKKTRLEATVRFRRLACYPQLPLVLKGTQGHIRYFQEMNIDYGEQK